MGGVPTDVIGQDDNPIDVLTRDRQIKHHIKQNPDLDMLVKQSDKQVYHPSPVLQKFLLPKPTVITDDSAVATWDIRKRYGLFSFPQTQGGRGDLIIFQAL